jgi:hypothetical protein
MGDLRSSANRASSHTGQGHKILMAILDRGRSGAILFRVKTRTSVPVKKNISKDKLSGCRNHTFLQKPVHVRWGQPRLCSSKLSGETMARRLECCWFKMLNKWKIFYFPYKSRAVVSKKQPKTRCIEINCRKNDERIKCNAHTEPNFKIKNSSSSTQPDWLVHVWSSFCPDLFRIVHRLHSTICKCHKCFQKRKEKEHSLSNIVIELEGPSHQFRYVSLQVIYRVGYAWLGNETLDLKKKLCSVILELL